MNNVLASARDSSGKHAVRNERGLVANSPALSASAGGRKRIKK
jgi:hypothetical protein